ncbi:MAG: PKD domain-containing protein [Candidatus Firestonebacteria bacterium]|nr:PKD domain-containing protein [Candidatus Firestonebacteria bacterium]
MKIINQRKTKSVVTVLVICILELLLNINIKAQNIGSSSNFKGVAWTSIGPGCGGGYLSALAIVSKGQSYPRMIYAGSNEGGFYKSIDDGTSWQILNNGLKNYDVEVIVYNPQNPDIIYIATSGGIYKTTNGGMDWALQRTGFPSIVQYSYSAPVSTLIMDPNDPNILYAGIGKWNEDDIMNDYRKGIIYKSTDAGEKWAIVNIGANNLDPKSSIMKLAIDKQNSNIIYAATDKGLYKSADTGVNWILKNNGLPNFQGENLVFVKNVVIDPLNSNIIYVVLYSKPNTLPWQGGVYKSIDAGENWQAINSSLEPSQWEKDQYSSSLNNKKTRNFLNFAVSPQNTSILYIGSTSWWGGGIWKSINGGETWSQSTSNSNVDSYPDERWSSGGISSISSFAADNSDSSFICFGSNMAFYKTIDGGQTWKQSYTERISQDSYGEYYWKGRGIETGIGTAIAIDTTKSGRLYFGYYDVGFLKSNYDSTAFKMSNAPVYGVDSTGSYPGTREDVGNAFSILVDPDSTNIIYTANGMRKTNDGLIAKSLDYGETWQVLGQPSNGLLNGQIWAIAIDRTTPVEARTIYAANRDKGIFKTNDGGKSWFAANNGLGGQKKSLRARAVAVDPNNSQIIYSGFLGIRYNDTTSSDLGGAYKSVDGGATWTKIGTSDIASVLDIEIDPVDSNNVYISTRRLNDPGPPSKIYFAGVYKSTDKGNTWAKIFDYSFILKNESKFYAVSSIAINPKNPRIIYAATDDQSFHDEYIAFGILRSRDGGSTWEKVNNGLSHLNINQIAIDPENTYKLYAATSGNGFFKGIDYDVDTTAPSTPVVIDQGALTKSTTTLSANWAASDPESDIAEYIYAIGSSQGSTDVVSWTSAGIKKSIARNDLSLTNDSTYFFSVKAKNEFGLESQAGYSDGILIDTTYVNQSPTVMLIADKTTGIAPLTVIFNAKAKDMDGFIISYEWDPEGSGAYSSPGMDSTISYTYTNPKTYNATVKVTDNSNANTVNYLDIIVTETTGVIQPVPKKKKSKKFCFISSIYCGSNKIKNLTKLNKVRDNYLIINPLGKIFTEYYYKISPYLNF